MTPKPLVLSHTTRVYLVQQPNERGFGMGLKSLDGWNGFDDSGVEHQGVYVSTVHPGSSAERAGVEEDWIIRQLNGITMIDKPLAFVVSYLRQFRKIEVLFDMRKVKKTHRDLSLLPFPIYQPAAQAPTVSPSPSPSPSPSTTTPATAAASTQTPATTSSAAPPTSATIPSQPQPSDPLVRSVFLARRSVPPRHPVVVTDETRVVAILVASEQVFKEEEGESTEEEDMAEQFAHEDERDVPQSREHEQGQRISCSMASTSSTITTTSMPVEHEGFFISPSTPVAADQLEQRADQSVREQLQQQRVSSSVSSPDRVIPKPATAKPTAAHPHTAALPRAPQTRVPSPRPVPLPLNATQTQTSVNATPPAPQEEPTSELNPDKTTQKPTTPATCTTHLDANSHYTPPPTTQRSQRRQKKKQKRQKKQRRQSQQASTQAAEEEHDDDEEEEEVDECVSDGSERKKKKRPRRSGVTYHALPRPTPRKRQSRTIDLLVEMGFPREDAQGSLAACGDDLDTCMLWCISQKEEREFNEELNLASIESERTSQMESIQHQEEEERILRETTELELLFPSSILLDTTACQVPSLKKLVQEIVITLNADTNLLRQTLTKILTLESQSIRWYGDRCHKYFMDLAKRLDQRLKCHDVTTCTCTSQILLSTMQHDRADCNCEFVRLLEKEHGELLRILFAMPENQGGVPLEFLRLDGDLQFSLDDDGFEVIDA